jgi:hypothetical protein
LIAHLQLRKGDHIAIAHRTAQTSMATNRLMTSRR